VPDAPRRGGPVVVGRDGGRARPGDDHDVVATTRQVPCECGPDGSLAEDDVASHECLREEVRAALSSKSNAPERMSSMSRAVLTLQNAALFEIMRE